MNFINLNNNSVKALVNEKKEKYIKLKLLGP